MMDNNGTADARQSVIFSGMSEEAVADLGSLGTLVSFEANHELFKRGEDADELMILQEGVVELLFPVQIMGAVRDVTIESKQAGDVVAWSAVVHPYRFTLSARCAGKCTLAIFPRDALWALFERDPQTGYLFMRNLAGVLGRRFQMMQTMWLHDLQASAVRRLG